MNQFVRLFLKLLLFLVLIPLAITVCLLLLPGGQMLALAFGFYLSIPAIPFIYLSDTHNFHAEFGFPITELGFGLLITTWLIILLIIAFCIHIFSKHFSSKS